ncbi:MAG TPA: DUF58 domain-containing protein [Candidatus Hydrogenedentes bacterium]|nr:DUF58 domain-containing protein [Candidatus Hydrogenedentota bacterium]HPG67427.1 DUF58 domain-containing protein [Candidatus Hydrogenedentota bacterium]
MIPQEVMQQIRRIQIRTNHMVNDLLAGQYESVFKGQGMEFKEVREYVPGDDVRMIDWNVTARTNTPHVKILAEERELTVMLVVDASGSGRFGSVSRFKNELAAELCAVLAVSAIKNNDKVGLIIFTDDVEHYVPPSKGRTHVLRVIREVLYYQPKGRGTNIPAALQYLNGVTKRRVVAFLVSDFIADDYEVPLRIANRRHDVIAVSVTDPREEELPDVGLVSVRDAETGRETVVNTRDAEVRARYHKAAAARAKRRDQIFQRTRVDAIDVRTDRSYVDALYKFFRMRERRYA